MLAPFRRPPDNDQLFGFRQNPKSTIESNTYKPRSITPLGMCNDHHLQLSEHKSHMRPHSCRGKPRRWKAALRDFVTYRDKTGQLASTQGSWYHQTIETFLTSCSRRMNNLQRSNESAHMLSPPLVDYCTYHIRKPLQHCSTVIGASFAPQTSAAN